MSLQDYNEARCIILKGYSFETLLMAAILNSSIGDPENANKLKKEWPNIFTEVASRNGLHDGKFSGEQVTTPVVAAGSTIKEVYYFTFMQKQFRLCDHYVRIEGTYLFTRNAFFAVVGPKFAFQYDEDQFLKAKKHFLKGEISLTEIAANKAYWLEEYTE